MPLIRGHHSFDDHFTQIPNSWVRDKRLSFKAIGLLAQIMSHKPGWNMSIRSLARLNETGVTTVKTAIEELEALGYLHRSSEQLRGEDGTFADYVWTTADPFQNPVTVESVHGLLDTKNTNTKKNNIKEITTKATTIPDDFEITESMRNWATEKHPGVDIEKATLNFIDYWKSKPKDNKQLDWVRTWQRWIRTTTPDVRGKSKTWQNKREQARKEIEEMLKNESSGNN
jgi:hypothetical protein